jgi:hypothetical protein
VLLGRDSRPGTGCVDQRDDRESVPLGEPHRAHRLAVALGMRHAEVAVRPLLDVAPLLVADEHDRLALEPPEPRHDRGVVGPYLVAVQLDPVREQSLDVIERVRPVGVARQLD